MESKPKEPKNTRFIRENNPASKPYQGFERMNELETAIGQNKNRQRKPVQLALPTALQLLIVFQSVGVFIACSVVPLWLTLFLPLFTVDPSYFLTAVGTIFCVALILAGASFFFTRWFCISLQEHYIRVSQEAHLRALAQWSQYQRDLSDSSR